MISTTICILPYYTQLYRQYVALIQHWNDSFDVCRCCGRILFDVIRQKEVKQSTACTLLWCFWCFCMCWCTKVFHQNKFNRNRYIAAIVFRLDLVCKIGDSSLCIIIMTQKKLNALRYLNSSLHVLPQWRVPIMHTCRRWDANFCTAIMWHVPGLGDNNLYIM